MEKHIVVAIHDKGEGRGSLTSEPYHRWTTGILVGSDIGETIGESNGGWGVSG